MGIVIQEWASIKEDWASMGAESSRSLLLGNGASIAIHREFGYKKLREIAEEKELLATTAPIFENFETDDFERVLLACWYAEQVNAALGSPSDTIKQAYEEVRKALIQAVHSVHPKHADVAEELERVGKFASQFQTVISLNYDLTFYWAMLIFNNKGEERIIWFKDAFTEENHSFKEKWKYMRNPYGGATGATLVFYPHGSLAVARDKFGDETKIASAKNETGSLLESIMDKWTANGHIPVFVSEGTSKQKLAAIHRSHYLTHVYEKVLPSLGENLVVYGWSFNEADQHVLEAIAENPLKRMAVSVFTGQSDEDQQAFCDKVRSFTKEFKSLSSTDVTFFDSKSAGCWNNPE